MKTRKIVICWFSFKNRNKQGKADCQTKPAASFVFRISIFTKCFNYIFKDTIETDKLFYLEHTFIERQDTVIMEKKTKALVKHFV